MDEVDVFTFYNMSVWLTDILLLVLPSKPFEKLYAKRRGEAIELVCREVRSLFASVVRRSCQACLAVRDVEVVLFFGVDPKFPRGRCKPGRVLPTSP